MPELATSVRASQDDDYGDDDDDGDDDDGDDDDFDIFLKPIRNPNDCMVNCSMGPGDFDIFLQPVRNPNDCRVNSI